MRPKWQRLSTLPFLAWTIATGAAAADTPALGSDGWHTWRVPAAATAGEWCCYTWNRGRPIGKGCNLDEDEHDFGSIDGQLGKSSQMQLYVRLADRQVEEIRVMNPRCPVTSSTEITDLGVLTSADSVSWLSGFVRAEGDLTQEALTAISTHVTAVPVLIDVVRNPALTMDTREQALFWLAVNGDDDAMDFFDRLLGAAQNYQ